MPSPRPRPRAPLLHPAGPGHEPPAPEPSYHEALRGPGAYHPQVVGRVAEHSVLPCVLVLTLRDDATLVLYA